MIKSSKKKVSDRRAKPILVPMDTSQLALPKPAKKVKETRITRSGRKIENAGDYAKTKTAMWCKQHGRCSNCLAFMPSPAFGHRHHPGGRGLGGGRRDDNKTQLICIDCHLREHHQ